MDEKMDSQNIDISSLNFLYTPALRSMQAVHFIANLDDYLILYNFKVNINLCNLRITIVQFQSRFQSQH